MRRMLRHIVAMIFMAAVVLAAGSTVAAAHPAGGSVLAGANDVPIGGGPPIG
jgi:hypothetical protein